MPQPFDAPFMQWALVELLLLSGLSAVLGPWIVLRRLAFFTHAAGMVTFPGLVVAATGAVAAAPAALVCAVAYAVAVQKAAARATQGVATGLLLVAALAIGAIMASSLQGAGANVDTMLFGTLIGLRPTDVALTALALVVAVGIQAAYGRDWLARGFDPAGSTALGVRPAAPDRALLTTVAVAIVAALAAVGALLISVLLVAPAATARLLADDMRALRRLTLAIAGAEGILALLLAERLDVAVGPALAVVAGLGFALAASVASARTADVVGA